MPCQTRGNGRGKRPEASLAALGAHFIQQYIVYATNMPNRRTHRWKQAVQERNQDKEENEDLREQVNRFQKHLKNYNIEIHGVPVEEGENTYEIASDISLSLPRLHLDDSWWEIWDSKQRQYKDDQSINCENTRWYDRVFTDRVPIEHKLAIVHASSLADGARAAKCDTLTRIEDRATATFGHAMFNINFNEFKASDLRLGFGYYIVCLTYNLQGAFLTTFSEQGSKELRKSLRIGRPDHQGFAQGLISTGRLGEFMHIFGLRPRAGSSVMSARDALPIIQEALVVSTSSVSVLLANTPYCLEDDPAGMICGRTILTLKSHKAQNPEITECIQSLRESIHIGNPTMT